MIEEEKLYGKEVLDYLNDELGPWVIEQLDKGRTPNNLPEDYHINFYGENKFTLTHEELVVIFEYKLTNQPIPKGYA